MSSFSGDRGAELRQIFFESAQDILQSLNEEALRLEKRHDDLDALRSLRRAVHTLKGDAAACGFRELSHLAHEFEDALVSEDTSQSAAIVETALAAADVFTEMLEAYRTEKPVAPAAALRKLIHGLSSPESAKRSASASEGVGKKRHLVTSKSPAHGKATVVATPRNRSRQNQTAKTRTTKNQTAAIKKPGTKIQLGWTEYERLAIESARHKSQPVYHLTLQIDPNCGVPEAALQIVRNILTKAGTILAFSPAEPSDLDAARKIDTAFSSKETTESLLRKCRVPGIISDMHLEPLLASAAAAPALDSPLPEEADATSPATRKDKPETARADENTRGPISAVENLLRVDAERIDNVLNLVGELIIGRSMFHQTLLEFAKRFPKDPLRTRFADAFAFQSRVLNDLQRSVMKIRMVPVEQLFRRFPRLVRDTARACGKNVELALSGQETDLDKGILDALAEPIAHLVRNAIAHGLENVEERRRAGKPEHGTLRLSAYHQGNQVIIEVADDGQGLDAAKIRNKAVARGLITAEAAQSLTESEILKFIFVPGFSTAEQITEISGRGVGLDVVQNVLHRLKGSVGVESTPGQKTVFRLRLPLTLAIIKAILFRVEHRLYAVPLNSVAEMTRVHQSEIHLVDGHEVMQLRKEVLTLVRLGRPAESSNTKLFVLVVSHAGQKLGLVVDELSGQEELVIKALDASILSTDLISGVSILGDGRVVLILNLASVAERRRQARNHVGTAPWGMLLPQSEMRQLEDSAAAAAGGDA